jgi:hypothetical protein
MSAATVANLSVSQMREGWNQPADRFDIALGQLHRAQEENRRLARDAANSQAYRDRKAAERQKEAERDED